MFFAKSMPIRVNSLMGWPPLQGACVYLCIPVLCGRGHPITLTELFAEVKSGETPVVVERLVTDIDEIVRLVRFPGWQNTKTGVREVQKALRKVIYVKYQIKDQDLFDKAYGYIEQYY
jgi:hypothetical protein